MRSVLKKVAFGGLSQRELKHYLHPEALANDTIRNTVLDMAASNSTEMYLNQMNATLDRQDLKMALNSFKFPITLVGGAKIKSLQKTKSKPSTAHPPIHSTHDRGLWTLHPPRKAPRLNTILKTALDDN